MKSYSETILLFECIAMHIFNPPPVAPPPFKLYVLWNHMAMYVAHFLTSYSNHN